ncbi:adenylate/guanylate cyclase domain-containing protein [Alicyclobacillus tolerans]|uniref:Adenylate cyclase, class 3 n=1 Tax=Alicyclobacillus tolerans TaxID=90970 RepID=A0A1M6TQZ6_9BACL|nr:adenylate/guanylate cyclase domain-containing protein [Alicyclobacillus montanus]SHK59238.1 Adenylate cyclase, class 3 [Alicyclobacillus montanus]
MPNLNENGKLFRKYGAGRKVAYTQKSLGTVVVTDSFDYQRVYLNPEFAREFDQRRKYEVVLTFIDISGFSKQTKDMSADEIAAVLDMYYANVIPLIYEYDGVVEKIIGDGIIAIFGEPFIQNENLYYYLRRAENFCRDAILTLNDLDIPSKCALHHGEVMYYSTVGVSDDYLDLTIIGEPITELFRLESVSQDGCLNYYSDTVYRQMVESDVKKPKPADAPIGFWSDETIVTHNLQGIGERGVMTLRPE